MNLLKKKQKSILNSLGWKCIVWLGTIFITSSVYSNPTLDNIGAGQVSIDQTNPNSTVINQTSQQAIINWQTFNIGEQESTHFQQPAGGTALNRVNPVEGPSSIYGRLTATGNIILVNPAGIFFGPNAYVNVGGLIASTANISDKDFLNGYYHFNNVSPYSGSVVNQGTIIAAEHGLVALIGSNVSNKGYIQANLGQVVLASGNSFTMNFAGNELISFSVDEKTISGSVSNSGVIRANGGKILVTAKTASGVLDNVINMTGVAEAKSVTQKNGEIILGGVEINGGSNGVVRVASNINVSGRESGQRGGKVKITGQNVAVESPTIIDAAGDKGGGEILIGGNAHGAGPLPNATHTWVDPDTFVVADALTDGNGGKVVVWSDHGTAYYGNIYARGGAHSGDGGWVEVSGENLDFRGFVDAGALHGLNGTLLLDPHNITINNVGGGTYAGTSHLFADATTTDSIISASGVGGLNNLGAGTNVLLQANNDITITSPITFTNTNTFTATAGRSILVNNTITTVNSAISLQANSTSANAANRDSGAGNITMASGTTLNAGNSTINLSIGSTSGSFTSGDMVLYNLTGAAMNISSPNTISLNGNILSSNDVAIAANTDISQNGDITASGKLLIAANAGGTGSGSYSLNSGNITVSSAASDALTIRANTASGGTGSITIGGGNIIAGNGGTITIATNHGGNSTGGSILQKNSGTGTIGFAGAGTIALSVPSSGSSTDQTVGSSSIGTSANPILSSTAGGTLNLTAGYGGAYVSNTGNLTLGTPTLNTAAPLTIKSSGTLTLPAASLSTNGNWDLESNGGSLTVTNPITLTMDNSLLLKASANIILNAAITALSGSLTLNAATSAASISTGASGTINVRNFNITQGKWSQIGTTLPSFTATNFQLNSGSSIANSNIGFIRAVNASAVSIGTVSNPYLIADVYGLQGMGANPTVLNNFFSLNNDIDATVTRTWNSGGGFIPIGNAGGTQYTSTFEGNNHFITNLFINQPSVARDNGLFGSTTGATIQNVGLVNARVYGANSAQSNGILVGFGSGLSASNNYVIDSTITGVTGQIGGMFGNVSSGTLSNNAAINVAVTSTSGGFNVGGLVGVLTNPNTLSSSYSTGSVTVSGTSGGSYGGLVGSNSGTISNSYSTASVTSAGVNSNVGGLVGGNPSPGSITNSYSTGAVTNTGSGSTVGGFVGANTGTLTNNFWDTVTSGQSSGWGGTTGSPTVYGGCFGATTGCSIQPGANSSNSGAAVNLASFSTYTARGWTSGTVISSTVSTGTTPSTTTAVPWLIFDAQTRPILRAEWNTSITTPHQVQLMGMALDGSYSLTKNIDMSSITNASDIWGSSSSGSGYIPVGTFAVPFTGNLNGQNHVITNLYINRPSTSYVGLFGAVDTTTFSNLGVSGTITGAGNVGLLAGYQNASSATNTFSTGSVSGGNSLGGLIGSNNGSTISNSYSSANVTGTSNLVGGLTGSNANVANINYSYATGNVSTNVAFASQTGGLVGSSFNSSNITNSYSTGTSTGGGFIGSFTNGTLSRSFWDTDTSGVSNGWISNTGTINSLQGGCFTGVCTVISGPNSSNPGSTSLSLSALATYTGASWSTTAGVAGSITSTPSTTSTAPNYTWFIFEGNTRPVLMSEWNNTINNAHQLQLMGTTLGATYTLASNIDLTSVGSTTNQNDIWGTKTAVSGTVTGSGFVPVGASSSSPFTGTFNGDYYVIDKLLIKRSTSDFQGLFGFVSGGTIQSVGLTNTSVTGQNDVGSLIGAMDNTNVMRVFSIGDVSASGSRAGGLIGTAAFNAPNSFLIDESFTAGTVTSTAVSGQTQFGGIVGLANSFNPTVGKIFNSYSMTNVAGGTSSAVGGIGGFMNNVSNIINSYAVGSVSTTDGNRGGLAGFDNAAVVLNSYWDTGATGRSIFEGGTFLNFLTGNNGAGLSTSTLMTQSNYQAGSANLSQNTVTTSSNNLTIKGTPWDLTNVWGIVDGKSYPYLRAFFPDTPRAMSGTAASTSSGTTIQLATNGTNLASSGLTQGTVKTFADGSYYFIEPYRVISDSSVLLAYKSGGSANAVTLAPTSGGSLTGLNMINNTLSIGDNNTNTITNANLSTAKGTLPADILYTVSGSDLSLNNGISFNSTANTTYSLNGNATETGSGSFTFNGPVLLTSSTPTISTSGGNINFLSNITASGASTLTLSMTGTTSSILGGTISTAISLIKAGTGTFTFSTAGSSYTGTTTINGGTLALGSGVTLPSTTFLTLANAGNVIFNVNGNDQTVMGLKDSSGGSSNSQVQLGSGKITVNEVSTETYGGVISGTGGRFTKSGAGFLTLAGNNTFTGATDITSGFLSLTSANALGSGATQSSAINLTSGAVLDISFAGSTFGNTNTMTLNGSGVGAGAVTFSGSGNTFNNPISLASTTTFGGTGNTTLAGNISGSGGLSKLNTGVLTLSGSNTYSGATTISSGSINLGSVGALGVGVGAQSSGTTVSSGAALDIGFSSGTLGNTNTISLNGTGISSAGALTFTGTNAILSNPINLATSTSVGGTGSGAFSGVMSGLIGSGFTKVGTGSLTLSNTDNTYLGSTTLSNGTLNVTRLADGGVNSSLGATAAATAITINSGVLSYAGGTDSTNRQFNISTGTIQTSSPGTLTLTGNIADSFTATFDTLGGDITLASSSLLNGAGGIIKSGSGTLTINNQNNTYFGSTLINAGTLSITKIASSGTNSSIGNSSATITLGSAGNSGTLTYTGSGDTSLRPISVSAAGTGGTIRSLNPGTLTLTGTIANNGLPLSIDAIGDITATNTVSGAGALTKTGAGVLTLSGTNNYSGGTSLSAGTLAVGSNSALGTGSLALNGGTLRSSTPVTLTNTFNVNSSSAIGGSNNLTQNGSVALNSGTLTISNIATTTFGGNVSGGGSISQTGGTVIMNGSAGSKTYSGGTSVTGGTLELGIATDAIGSGTLTLGTGSLLRSSLTASLSNPFTVSGATTIGGSNALTLSNNGVLNSTLSITNTNTTTLSGNLSGGLGFLAVNAPGGTINLSGSNSYGSGTVVNGGTVVAQNNSALGTAAAAINSGGTLQITNGINVSNNLTISGTGSSSQGALVGTGASGATASGIVTLSGNTTVGTLSTTDILILSNTVSGAGQTLTTQGPGTNTFNGLVNVGTVAVTNTGSAINFNGNLTATALTTVNQAYNLVIAGLSNSITNAVNFLNTGTVSIGSSGSTSTFAGGLATTGNASNPSGTTVNGTVQTNGNAMNLGAVTLGSTSTLATNNTVAAGSALNVGTITSNGNILTLNAGTGGAINGSSFTGNGNLTIVNSGDTTFSGTTNAGTITLTNTTGTISFNNNVVATALNTANQAYNVSLLGGANTITNAVNFLNTGSVAIGSSGGTSTFTGGLATTGNASNPSSTNLSGAIIASNANITLGTTSLVNDSSLTSGGGAITLGTTNSGAIARSLTLAAGAGAINLNGSIGATTALSSFTASNTGGANDFTIAQNIRTNGNISLTAGNNLAFSSNLNSIGGDVSLAGTAGSITQSGGSIINGGLLTTSSATGTTLTNTNTISSFNGTNTTSGNIALTANGALGITGINQTGGNLTLITGGNLTQSGAIIDTGNASFTVGANAITLNNASNNITGSVTLSNSGVNGVTVTNSAPLILAASNVGGGILQLTGAGLGQTGAITQAGAGAVTLNGTTGTINLASANNFLGVVSLLNSGAGNANNITLNNTGTLLTLGTSSFGSGTMNVTNTGMLIDSGVITASGGNVNLTTLSPDASARTLTINSNGVNPMIQTNGGSIILTAANDSTGLGIPLIVNGILDTSPGSGGTLTTSGGVALNATPNLGAGSITLQGNGEDLSLGTLNFTQNSGFSVNRFLTITGVLTTSGGASLTLRGDSSNTGLGGVFLATGAAINSSGGLTLQGSSLNGYVGADPNAGVQVENGVIINAAGPVVIQALNGNGNVKLDSNIVTTGDVTLQAAGTGVIDLGGNVTSNGGAVNFNSPVNLVGSRTVNAGTGDIVFANTVNGSGQTLTLQNNVAAGGAVTFGNNVTLAGLTTFAQPYSVTFNGLNNTFTNAVTFNNTNGVILGNSLSSVFNFNNGLTSNAGTTNTIGSINTTDALVSLGNTVLAGNTNITAGASNIVLGAVTGNSDLVLSSGVGSILNGAVNIGTLTLNGGGTDVIAAPTVTTQGNQTYNDAVSLDGDPVLTVQGNGSPVSIAFNNGISGLNIALNGGASGDFSFAINGPLAMNSISVNGVNTGNNVFALDTGNAQAWTINGSNASAITTSGVTTNISLSNIQNLTGGAGNDAFTVAGGTLSGVLSGGGGANTLTADNTTNQWNITDENKGSISSGSSGATTTAVGQFNNIQTLAGGSSDDEFFMSSNGKISNLSGGGGNNTIVANNSNTTNWNITGSNSGSTSAITNFTNIQNLVGGSGVDVFNLSGSLSGNITGGTGTSTLIANALSNAWVISGTNSGTVTGLGGQFVNIANLSSNGTLNYFTFSDQSKLTGLLNGMNLNNDTILDFTNYSGTLTINLPGITAPIGSAASGNGNIVSFTNIHRVMGNNNQTTSATLQLPNEHNDVFITGTGMGYVNDPVFFSNFRTFRSTSGNDTVTFPDGTVVNPGRGEAIVNGVTLTFIGFNLVGTGMMTGEIASVMQQPFPTPIVDDTPWLNTATGTEKNIENLKLDQAALDDKTLAKLRIKLNCFQGQ